MRLVRAAREGLAFSGLAVVAAGALAAQEADPPPLDVGQPAPPFALVGATKAGVLADSVRLTDLAGKTVVLAFFYQARTKG